MQSPRRWLVPVVIFAAVVILVALLSWPAAAVVTLAAMPIAFLRRKPRSTPVEVKGVQAHTARLLAKLPRSFTVFHRVSVGDVEIDHIVVGPSGVWAIMVMPQKGDVEEYEDGVRMAGRWMPYDPRQGIGSSANVLSELLRSLTGTAHWVESLVCFPQARVRTLARPDDAQVVGSRHLLPRLTGRTNRLSARQGAGVISVLRELAKADARARTNDRSEDQSTAALAEEALPDHGAVVALAGAPSSGNGRNGRPVGRSGGASRSSALSDHAHELVASRAAVAR